MGKKGDIGDWENLSKKWLEIIYKLIEKPEKKEFRQAAELAVKTQKLLNECEFPLDQSLVMDLRNQLATILNATDYVLNNVPKGNYYMVMPDYLTHITRLVLLIAKVIQNIWSQKHGVLFQYVPPEATVYLTQSQQSFFRREMTQKTVAPQQQYVSATPQQIIRPRGAGLYPQVKTVYQQPTYPPQYYYSKAYKYVYWKPKSNTGKKLALVGLLTFLPSFFAYLRYKSTQGGVTPHDVQLLRSLINKFNELSKDVTIPNVDLNAIGRSLNDIGEKISTMDIATLQKTLVESLESVGNQIMNAGKVASDWLKDNVPKIISEIQNRVRSGNISPVELDDITRAMKNVGALVGDQIKELPTMINNGINQLNEFIKANAPQLLEASKQITQAAQQAVSSLVVGLGGIKVPSPDQIDFDALSKMANQAVQTTGKVLEEAGKELKKFLDSLFGG